MIKQKKNARNYESRRVNEQYMMKIREKIAVHTDI